MERDPGDFSHRGGEAAGDVGYDAVDRAIADLPPCPGLPSTDEKIEATTAEAKADIAAGRFVSHDAVTQWLKTVGTPDHRPMPREWLE